MAVSVGTTPITAISVGATPVTAGSVGTTPFYAAGGGGGGTGMPVLQGVYRQQGGDGGGGDAGNVVAYQDWLGYPIDFVETFVDEPTAQPTSTREARWQGFTVPNWVTDGLRVNAPGLTLMVGVGSFISSDDGKGRVGGPSGLHLDGERVGHDLVPTGVYDSYIRQQAVNMLAYVPTGPIYVRLNHEFNINQFGHRAHKGYEADFVASWRHYVNVQREVDTERRIKYVWNPSLSSGTQEYGRNVYTQLDEPVDIDKCYPGDDYVDRIGPDCYDQGGYDTGGYYVGGGDVGTGTAQIRERNWARKRTGTYLPTDIETDKVTGINCLNGLRDYALAGATRNGVPNCAAKPFSLPEVGLWWGVNGGGDNPYFTEKLLLFGKAACAVNGGDISWWEHPTFGVFDTNGDAATATGSRAAFLNQRPIRNSGGALPARPNAPTIGVITAGDGRIVVPFTPSATGTAATSFTAFASTGQSQSGTVSPITVVVPNGVAVTATVKANNSGGSSDPSAASNSVTPVALAPTSQEVSWLTKAGSTITRPVNTYYRATAAAAGNLEAETSQIVIEPGTKSVTISTRQAVGTAKPGDLVMNVLTAAGGYLGTIYPTANTTFTPGTAFSDVTRTFDLTGTAFVTAARATLFVAHYNAAAGDAIELGQTVSIAGPASAAKLQVTKGWIWGTLGDSFITGVTEPTASNSGIRTPTTSTVTGTGASVNLTTPNQVFNNVLFVNVRHSIRAVGIKFNDCRWIWTSAAVGALGTSHGNGFIDVYNSTTHTGTEFNHCEFACQATDPKFYGFGNGYDYKAYRCKVIGGQDGFGIYNTAAPTAPVNVRIEGCYVDELQFNYSPTGGVVHPTDTYTHNDCVQQQGGAGLEIIGNAFHARYSTTLGTLTGTERERANRGEVGSLAAVMFSKAVSYAINPIVENNWFYGGKDVIINAGYDTSVPLDQPFGRIRYNKFGPASVGNPPPTKPAGALWLDVNLLCDTTGNTYLADGSAVPRRNG